LINSVVRLEHRERRATKEMPMATPPPYPETNATGVEPDRPSTAGTPRGVYVFWIIVAVLVVLMVVLHLTGTLGPGSHGR
jgi:hypothetical protein